ncbi:hypothetical protein CC1G_09267 [Coprinopsis cinerea okayama7|uniref:BTB domain-containing protein n=1 Tax=Coprinopsis cinerea (strain Okayama-7 / 130 / ATCC MYA-4618 / FGSC 9003) TaxID=240176 RepID=A8N846_COPC7|nr:hypothetical protein CC1G_09267 [Coprinopsis cinerea okayama7\|eukprot:XP_001831002.2 hypothetical protein CC1G_09267 [Coprinopsis cinerea okayama7\
MRARFSSSSNFIVEFKLIQVENRLYKIPRYRLVALSPVFADMFSLPQSHSEIVSPDGRGIVEGESEDRPIVLEGCRVVDFERLLALVYPRDDWVYGDSPPLTSLDEWVSALKLATLWQMEKIIGVAIAQLDEMELSETTKIRLGRAYGVKRWISEGVEAIASLKDVTAIPLEDLADTLGWEVTARILWARASCATTPLSGKADVPFDKIRCKSYGCGKRVLGAGNLVCEGGHRADTVQKPPIRAGGGTWVPLAFLSKDTIGTALAVELGDLVVGDGVEVNPDVKKEIMDLFQDEVV